MSGPKCYSIPPRYSADVFDGKLNEIFCLQSKIKSRINELSHLSFVDSKREISFNCQDVIEKNKARISELLKVFSLNITGTFGQETYNSINNQLAGKISQLNAIINELNSQKREFQNKKEDYNAYIHYENYYLQTLSAIESFKSQVIEYLSSYVQGNFPELFQETQNALELIDINISKANFEFDFRHSIHSKKEAIENEFSLCKSKINEIRGNTSEKVLDCLKGQGISGVGLSKTKFPKVNKKIQAKIEKIEEFISNVIDPTRQEAYKEKLSKLAKGSLAQDLYYYKELLEDLKESEKTFQIKKDIHDIISELNQIETHHQMAAEKSKIIQGCLNLMEKERITPNEYDDVLVKANLFKEKNEKTIQEESIKEKERQFLKVQLISILQDMNYEVADDLNVIDFEKESDFLLRIPEQENFLNLRFNDDGSFLYNFLIPESKNELSIEQRQRKLQEMESTCHEFKGILKELAGLGLQLDLKKEMAATEQALIQLPKKYHEKIKAAKPHKLRKKVEKKQQMRM
jgi:hypothetical protein